MKPLILALGLCLAPAALGAGEKPLPLVGLESARTGLATGYVIWSTRCNLPRRPEDEGILYRWYSFDTPRYFTSRFTPHEYMVEDDGDPRGVVWPIENGEPHPYMGYNPVRYLLYDGDQYEYRHLDSHARLLQGHNDLVDVRAFGISTGFAESLETALHHGKHSTYEVRRVDGLYEVIVGSADSSRATRYRLDPDRGWNPVEVAELDDGEVLHEARTTLKQYGDVWFPERVELYDEDYQGGREPSYVVEVLSASFNQPDQPRRLTPASIGIDVGMSITLYERGNIFQPRSRNLDWDGVKPVTLEEYSARAEAGELKTGPRTREAWNRMTALSPDVDDGMTMWEGHVAAFIRRYRLNEEQAEQCRKILRRCQERARRYLARNEDQIAEIRAAVNKLYSTSQPGHADRDTQMAKLKERMLRLKAPLSDIYYRDFLPPLERIPTRAQRQAVADREGTTQPATAP